MKFGSKTIAIVLLFIGLVLANYLATSLPLRLDATADKIYTLSTGTKTLLGKIEEPITLEFYYTKDAKGLPVSYKNYAARVQEMLRQYVRASKGKLTLRTIDPKPDTPEEERATAAGLQPQLLPTGEQFNFGLVAIQADQQKVLASFNPQREAFLEYDLSQLIYSVQQIDKKKLGLLSSLPLRAVMDPMSFQRGQRMPQSQYVISEWEKSFEIVPVEQGATELPAGLDVLAVVHPQNLSPKLQYAIDQFILSGKPVLIAVDPSSQYFKDQRNPMQMYGGPKQNVSSDLPLLFQAYGIEYKADAIVGDTINAAKVQTGAGVVSYPIWLNMDRKGLNPKSLPTAQLTSILFVEAGSISLKKDSPLTFTDLVHTSDQAGDVPSMAAQFAQPEDLAREIKPSGVRTLAALISGKFKTAFPDGAPKDPEQKPDAEGKKPETPAKADAAPGLKESKTTSSIIVVADTDWLLDDFSVRRFNFLGVQAAEPLNDNLNFGANSLEYLGGSQDLVSIRGKGNSLRPFTVVKAMESEARKKYEKELSGVEDKLKAVQTKLGELKGKKGDARTLVASPEVRKALEDYQKQEAEARRERRVIRRALREDIDKLENTLLVVNLAIPPVLVGIFGLWFLRRRRT